MVSDCAAVVLVHRCCRACKMPSLHVGRAARSPCNTQCCLIGRHLYAVPVELPKRVFGRVRYV